MKKIKIISHIFYTAVNANGHLIGNTKLRYLVSSVNTPIPGQTIEFLRDESSRTKEFLRDESSRTKKFLSSRCARPNKGTVKQRDNRTKGQPNKGTGANYPPLPAHANEVLMTSLLC